MKALVGIPIALFMLFAWIALMGAGHGWVSGGVGCLAMAPLAILAATNAMRTAPSRRAALAVLALAAVVLVAVAVATRREGVEYFFNYFRINGAIGVALAGIAYGLAPTLALLAVARSSRGAPAG